MVIVITKDGLAYHRTDGLPLIWDSVREAELMGYPENCDFLELTAEEAYQLNHQAFVAIYGWRYGLRNN